MGDVQSVQTSCGFAVPLMTFEAPRVDLIDWAGRKGEQALVEYRRTKNAVSLDGLFTPATDPS